MTHPVTRRAFLGGAAAALALAGWPESARGGATPGFSFGPMSTDVTPNSALVWLRADGRRRLAVQFARRPDFSAARKTEEVAAGQASDFTALFRLDGLAPGTQYFYRGVSGGLRGAVGRFRTPPLTAAPFSFAFSADNSASFRPFLLYERIAARAPDFFLHLGDTAYTDWPRDEFRPSLAHYRFKHREVRADPYLQDFLARLPTYAVWDDHEVQNDFDRTHPHMAEGRRAFREYWPLVSAGENILYRRFSWTPAADFLLLDCRSYRSPKDQADGPAKTMLGATQKAWLKEMLSASRAPFKFIISSVAFSGPFGQDRWQGYATERDEIRTFIRDENIKGVVILSADVHLAMDIHRPDGISEFVAGPIAAPTACQMKFFARLRLAVSGRFYICDELNYALIRVRPEGDPPRAELVFLGIDDRIRHRVTIDAFR